MQTPIILFDHVKGEVFVTQKDALAEKRVQESRAAQMKQVTSSAGSPAR
jgi:hypothetical protein